MSELQWEPGQPKHGFDGLCAHGSNGYRYDVYLNPNDVTVKEISTFEDWEILTRYTKLDRDLGFACQYAQCMNDADKPDYAREYAEYNEVRPISIDLKNIQ